ncbi:MAG TPA: hypothetical protein VLA73_08235 [Burkholderiales bacterium]|nr:hypothetical protein [Burkholderiales bacterium]
MNRFFFKLLMGLFAMAGTAVLLLSQGHAQRKERVVIEITDPKSGAKVDKEAPVQGTARLPPGYHLWVLARRTDHRPLWVPQQEAEVDPATQKWSATAVFGAQQDVGSDYDVGVVVVDDKGHAALAGYHDKATKTGDWKPIEIPPGSSSLQTLTVKKVRH